MNGFDNTFAFAFYISFTKIELNCDKENMLILNKCCFQRKMSKCGLGIYSLVLKTAVCWKFCKTCRNKSMTELTVKEVTVYRVVTFLNEELRQIYF